MLTKRESGALLPQATQEFLMLFHTFYLRNKKILFSVHSGILSCTLIIMGSGDSYNFKWNEFSSNIQKTFRSFRNEESLSDVTLLCGEETLTAHKLVLSASSEFFQNIFRKCRKENPIIVLKVGKRIKMSPLLDFMYKGEVRIEQDDLPSFLELARELKIRGVSGEELQSDRSSEKHAYAPYSNSSSQLLQSHGTSSNSSNFLQASDIQSFPSYEEISKDSLQYTEPPGDSKFDTVSSLGSEDYQLVTTNQKPSSRSHGLHRPISEQYPGSEDYQLVSNPGDISTQAGRNILQKFYKKSIEK